MDDRSFQISGVGIGDAIKAARERAGRSQLWLGQQVGQSQTGISSWERGRTEPSREDVVRVADALAVPLSEIEGQARENPSVPVVGYIGAGDAAHFYSEDQGELDRVEPLEGASPLATAREIRGQSIGRFFDGWLIFTEPRQRGVPGAYLGQLCEVHLPDGRVLVKQVQKSKFEGVYHLLSETEPAMMDEEVEWSAKVIGMRPR